MCGRRHTECAAYEFGHVVIADIADPDGNPCDHEHTAMVLRPPDDAGNLYLLAISTKFTRPLSRFMIEVPFAEGGHPVTGLSRPCVLKCGWVVRFHAKNIRCRIGRIPAKYAELAVEYAISAVEEKRKTQAKTQSPE